MGPSEIMAWAKGFHVGIAAERKRCRTLLAQADAIASELEQIKLEVVRLEALAICVPDEPVHWRARH